MIANVRRHEYASVSTNNKRLARISIRCVCVLRLSDADPRSLHAIGRSDLAGRAGFAIRVASRRIARVCLCCLLRRGLQARLTRRQGGGVHSGTVDHRVYHRSLRSAPSAHIAEPSRSLNARRELCFHVERQRPGASDRGRWAAK